MPFCGLICFEPSKSQTNNNLYEDETEGDHIDNTRIEKLSEKNWNTEESALTFKEEGLLILAQCSSFSMLKYT